MGVREGKVEKYLVDQIEKIGGTAYKFVSPGRVGVPDRIVCYNGVVIFVEVKSPSGDLSLQQKRELIRLDGMGHLTACCHSKCEVDHLVKGIWRVFFRHTIQDLIKRLFESVMGIPPLPEGSDNSHVH